MNNKLSWDEELKNLSKEQKAIYVLNYMGTCDTNTAWLMSCREAINIATESLKNKENKMKTTVKFAKVKEGAIIPSKRKEDAGYDIYPCFEQDYIKIAPHETVMIPTGIASSFSENYVMELKERGSTGTKGIAQRCGVIDSGFRNEWQVPITNTSNKIVYIYKNNKEIEFSTWLQERPNYGREYILYPYEKAICQALLLPVPETDIEEISYEELLLIKSERGNGMLGSSGK